MTTVAAITGVQPGTAPGTTITTRPANTTVPAISTRTAITDRATRTTGAAVTAGPPGHHRIKARPTIAAMTTRGHR